MEFYSLKDLFAYIASVLSSSIGRRRRQEDLYSSNDELDGMLSELRTSGGYRKQELHEIGPVATTDGTTWQDEHIHYDDIVNGIENEIDIKRSRRCSCGEVLGYKNNVLGTCMVCGSILCSTDGCAHRCEYCGNIVCTRHAKKYGEHTFCTRHRFIAWWRLFWEYRI